MLSDLKIREILIEFNKKNSILLSEFLESKLDKEKDELKRTLNFLSGQKVLEKSLIVICSKTNQWWNMTIPSQKQLKEIEKSEVTCASCGAKISDERIDTLFKISEKGRKMISGSYWMSGQVVNNLLKFGIRENDVFVGVTFGGEEIDIIALFMGEIFVFELKDREFGLGDAYKFHGKVSRLEQKCNKSCDSTIYPIVVTTKTVASEARKLLTEVPFPNKRHYLRSYVGNSPQGNYFFAEGLGQIEPMLKKLTNSCINEKISLRMKSISRRVPANLLLEDILQES